MVHRPSGSDPSDRSLAAYLVMAGEPEPEPEDADLLDFLRSRLPAYMVPPGFARIAAMPLTPNGKLDRAALLALGGPEPVRPAFVTPRTPVEQRIAEIWSEVLGHEPVGIHDNFFELGGHSLLMTRVASRLRAAFAIDLPLRILLEAPTVARSAEQVETVLWARQAAAPAGVAAAGEEEGEL
jgi:acyl carrier protein